MEDAGDAVGEGPRVSELNTGENDNHENENLEKGVQTYKSWKKKFRKMRAVFEEKMRLSDKYCMDEEHAGETAKRLAIEIDRLLDLLLDVNDSAQIPSEKRVDLGLDTPSISAVPSLVTSEELERAYDTGTSAGDAIYKEARAILEEKAAAKAESKPPRSLTSMLAQTPHLTPSAVDAEHIAELEAVPEGYAAPLSYLTADQIDEALYDMDASMGLAPEKTPKVPFTDADLPHRNPHSVYNWLRQHKPQIFLQDGESVDKQSGKPGALRGAGKRANLPGPTKPDSLEIVEEDGQSYDPTIGGLEPITKGKRKREDDGGYHPKMGTPNEGKGKKRPRKKKGDSDETIASTPASGRKGKGRGKGRSSDSVVEAAAPLS